MNFHKLATMAKHPVRSYKTCFFAITNSCNGRCSFCSIWKMREKVFPKKEDVKRALDFLHKNGIRYLQYTGGEPFLYPDIFEICKYASEKGFFNSIATNGSLIDESAVRKIKDSGIDALTISVDHYDPKVVERNRGIPNLLSRVETSADLLQKNNVPFFGTTTICRMNYKELRSVVEYQEKKGFDYTVFCYPMTSMDSTFKIGGGGKLIEFSNQEMIDVLNEIIAMKKEGYKILNPKAGLEDMIRFLEGKKVKYPCLGGQKIFYLDWHLNLYKCMKKSEVICSALDNVDIECDGTQCNECMLECFRDPSVFYYGFRSLKSFYDSLGVIKMNRYVSLPK